MSGFLIPVLTVKIGESFPRLSSNGKAIHALDHSREIHIKQKLTSEKESDKE